MHYFEYFGAIVIGFIIGIYILVRYFKKEKLKEVAELNDCPFPFDLETEDQVYIIFDLGDNTKLWCEYGFGLRSDGVFGVNDLKLRGINTKLGGTIQLSIGQSVFPLIDKMNQFEAWAKTKAFDYQWESYFLEAWKDMKKKLDNLRFLETKSKEKEKKPK